MPQANRSKPSRRKQGKRLRRRFRSGLSRAARRLAGWTPTKRRLLSLAAVLVLAAAVLLLVLLPRREEIPAMQTAEEEPFVLLPASDAVVLDWETLNENKLGIQNDGNLLTELEEQEVDTVPLTPDDGITLRYGMESPRVTELQNRLMELGYLDIDEATLYFGSATKQAVKAFQRQCGAEQDGIAGILTQAILFSDEAPRYAITNGMYGTDIESLQRKLKELGYLSQVTGYYGTQTVQAVREFQQRNKLSVDGLAGEKTFSMIYSPEAKASAKTVQSARKKANISTMISVASKQLGKKYILGAEGPNSFDCSGLVYYCLKQAGSNRGRYNAAGYSKVSDWQQITSMSKLQRGDLIFFYNNAKTKVGHVGIYIGSGTMIDASSSNGKVVKRSCTTAYWKKHFVCGRRPW